MIVNDFRYKMKNNKDLETSDINTNDTKYKIKITRIQTIKIKILKKIILVIALTGP